MALIALRPYGAVTGIDPGSGVSGPPGLETKFEYNGLYLNDLSLTDKYRVMSIDGLADADIRDSRAVNPGRHGETAFQAFYGGRTLVLSGRIEAHTLNKLRDMQQALRLAFNELEEKPLILHSFHGPAYDMVIYCRKGASITMGEKQEDWRYFRDFQLTLRAANPRFLTYDQKAETWTAANTSETFAFMFGATNAGTFEAEPKFIVTGPITDAYIYNHTTGEAIVIDGTIPLGESWTIDVAKRTVFDNYGVSHLGSLSPTSRWVTVQPAGNYYELSATGLTVGTTSISILYHNTWI